MKLHRNSLISFLICSFIILTSEDVQSQNKGFEIPPTNPHGIVIQRIAATDIEVNYNRPSMKGRKIFGELVPYKQVWRTGSDASTKINFSTPVVFNQNLIDSGSYELFTIPGEKEWIIILQANKNQWGSYRYNAEADIHRSIVVPQTLAVPVESFSIGFENLSSNSAEIALAWENVKVSIPIEVDLKTKVLPKLEESLKQSEKPAWFRAAMFYFENKLDINRAAELMAKAIAENPNHLGMLYRQALILEEKGDFPGAIAASEKSMELARNAGQELKDEYISLNTTLLNRLRD